VFERYTEKARRAIFFARYEASQYGTSAIEAEHILLGILREDKPIARFLRRGDGRLEEIRRKIEDRCSAKRGKRISTSVDLPLSQDFRRIVKNAAEVADHLAHRHIGTEHLFLALAAEQSSWTAGLLRDAGIQAADLRQQLACGPEGTSGRTLQVGLDEFVRAWIERDLESFLEFFQENALLVDERGNLHAGREQIADYCARVRGDAKNLSTLRATPGEIQYFDERIAIVPFEWEFAGAAPGHPSRIVRSLLAMRNQDGEWLIVAAQLTEVRSTDAESNLPGKPAES
jgi:uncharacterized protein (TIGR02246 family)